MELLQTADPDIWYDLTPESWFDLITIKIDTLHEVERKLADMLAHTSAAESPPAQAPQADKERLFSEYDTLIRSLQIFSGLTDDQVREVLQHAQIRTFSKGKLLFLEIPDCFVSGHEARDILPRA